MADVLRDPLFVSGRGKRSELGSVFNPPSLLLTTLAVVAVALPVGQARCESAPQLRQIYADTSQSSPKVLLLNEVPFRNLSFQPAQCPVILGDASQGQSLILRTLTAAAPFVNPQWTAVESSRINSDTSQSAYALRFAAAAAPFSPVAFPGVLQRSWQPADTSQSAYALQFAIEALPPGKSSFVATPNFRWQPLDTSQDAYSTLYPVAFVPFPVGGSSLWAKAPQWPNWQSDTTLGSPTVALQNVQPLPPAPPGPSDVGGSFAGGGGKREIDKLVDEIWPFKELGPNPTDAQVDALLHPKPKLPPGYSDDDDDSDVLLILQGLL